MAVDSFEFNLSGVDDVVRRMSQLPDKLQRKALQASVRKGAAVVRKAAVANAKTIDDPETGERIWKNITSRLSAKLSRKEGGAVIRVGVMGGARKYGNNAENRRKRRVGKIYRTGGDSANPGGDTWYWRFQEFGTSRQRARPFLRPALANNVNSATDAIVAELNKQLDRLVASNASE